MRWLNKKIHCETRVGVHYETVRGDYGSQLSGLKKRPSDVAHHGSPSTAVEALTITEQDDVDTLERLPYLVVKLADITMLVAEQEGGRIASELVDSPASISLEV